MIDFTLSDHDQNILDRVREQALIARKYARHYDENEHEFPPTELPEAKDHPSVMKDLMQRGEGDCGIGTLGMLISMGETWGDYSVRIRIPTGAGLGNAALSAAGTPEQKKRWAGLTLVFHGTSQGQMTQRIESTILLSSRQKSHPAIKIVWVGGVVG